MKITCHKWKKVNKNQQSTCAGVRGKQSICVMQLWSASEENMVAVMVC